MLDNYLQILIECLEKKQEILERIKALNEEQAECLRQEIVDKVAFDQMMNEKAELVQKLDKLDAGFEETYEIIRPKIKEHKESYILQLKQLQSLVAQVVETGVSIKAQETRLKQSLDSMFQSEYKRLNQKRLSYKATRGYYQSMHMINYIDPQLMDSKK